MRNLVFIALALAGAGLIAFALFMPQRVPEKVAEQPKAASGPNVVFIIVDTLRADRLHGERNGIPIMPKLSALAKQGRDFSMAISPASHTRSAVASLMSGQYVDTHGVYFGAWRDDEGAMSAHNLASEWQTLAEVLSDAGYTNFGYVTNGNIQGGAGYGQGFAPENYRYEPDSNATQVTDALIAQAESAQAPFHLFALYLEPHGPYYPPKDYRSLFGEVQGLSDTDHDILQPERQIPYLLATVQNIFGHKVAERFTPLSEAGRETMRTWYDGECRYIDDEVSRMVSAIRKKHPNTLFIITSDHGEEFWEHEGMGHGTTLYQEQIHVPLIILGPKVKPGAITVPVGTIGIYQTVCAYLGITPNSQPQGDNLLGDNFLATGFTRTRGPSSDFEVDLNAIVRSTSKGIRNADRMYAYDLVTDPMEMQPLNDEVVSGEFNRLLDEHRSANTQRRPARISPEAATISKEDERLLQELGYIQPPD